MKIFKSEKNYVAAKNTILGPFKLESVFEELGLKENYKIENAVINIGGWQSWSPCFEIETGKAQPDLTKCPIKSMNGLLNFPDTRFKSSKRFVLSQFVSYLRWQDFYLVFASCSSTEKAEKTNLCPPVQFVFDRKENIFYIELADKGKFWKNCDVLAKIEIFAKPSFFEAKSRLKEIFDCNQFEKIKFLGNQFLGWESWYNHYTKIDEKIILSALESLKTTQNLITFLQGENPVVFQIDDGWENMVGDWEINTQKFPDGLKELANKIETAGFISGLWMAPFLVYQDNPIAKKHPEWLLRDDKGKLVCAGLNPGWNGFKKVRTLDISRDDVLEYLDFLMERAINEWGFRYIKLDFMYAGMLYGNFSKKGAAFEWYERAIKLLTKRQFNKEGKPVAYLGCGIPMEQSFKEFPLSRIGCDTCENWENSLMKKLSWFARNEAFLNLKDTIGRAMWNGTIYANDPDVIFIRNENCTLTKQDKTLIAHINSMFASQIMYSDDPETSCSTQEVELAKEIAKICTDFSQTEFGIKLIKDDLYEFFSKDGKVCGKIDLMAHKIAFD